MSAKIDRIACPWLIRRFVDPDAVFLFVAPAEVQPVAERFDAGVRLGEQVDSLKALLADDVVQHAGTHPHCRAVARLAPQRLRQPANRRHRATVPH